ncbi:MAG: helix-turn-helix transcriptional regulator [Candidatus Methylumidiphilus sp.]
MRKKSNAVGTTAPITAPKPTHTNFDDLPRCAYARVAKVADVVGFSIPSIWRKAREGTFPRPVRLSGGVTAWNVGGIRDWLEAQAKGVL